MGSLSSGAHDRFPHTCGGLPHEAQPLLGFQTRHSAAAESLQGGTSALDPAAYVHLRMQFFVCT